MSSLCYSLNQQQPPTETEKFSYTSSSCKYAIRSMQSSPHTCFGKEWTLVYHQVASTDVVNFMIGPM